MKVHRLKPQTEFYRTLVLMAALLALYVLILRGDVLVQFGRQLSHLWPSLWSH